MSDRLSANGGDADRPSLIVKLPFKGQVAGEGPSGDKAAKAPVDPQQLDDVVHAYAAYAAADPDLHSQRKLHYDRLMMIADRYEQAAMNGDHDDEESIDMGVDATDGDLDKETGGVSYAYVRCTQGGYVRVDGEVKAAGGADEAMSSCTDPDCELHGRQAANQALMRQNQASWDTENESADVADATKEQDEAYMALRKVVREQFPPGRDNEDQ